MQRKIKNVVKNYTNSEIKVREATSNDPWGPSSVLMSEIATLTFDTLACSEMMSIIWKRVNDHGKNWRHVYKSLVLLEFLVRTGSERVVRQCKDNLILIQTLRDFQYVENGLDCGLNVREAAKALYNLMRDEEKLKSERSRAAGSKARFGDMRSYPSSAGELAVNSYGTERKYRPFVADTYELDRHSSTEKRHSPTNLSSQSRQPGRNPEPEAYHPSNQNEEELQLQLALAMSKEEHEAEMKKKKGEEIKLQMAIEESKKTAEQEKMWRIPAAHPENRDKRKPVNLLSSSSSDLLGQSFDPWSVSSAPGGNAPSVRDPWKTRPEDLNGFSGSRSDDDVLTAQLYSSVSKPTASGRMEILAPWEEVAAKFSRPPVPVAAPSAASDDFLEISSRHVATASARPIQPRKASVDDWLGGGASSDSGAPKASNLLDDLWGSNADADQDGGDLLKLSSAENQEQKTKNAKKITPEEFLGPNAKLVDFNDLVSKPKQQDAWNPFAMTQSSKGPAINPFVAKALQEEKIKRVPLNQLQSSTGNPPVQSGQTFNYETSSFNQSQLGPAQASQLSSFSTPTLALIYAPQPIAQNQSYNPFL